MEPMIAQRSMDITCRPPSLFYQILPRKVLFPVVGADGKPVVRYKPIAICWDPETSLWIASIWAVKRDILAIGAVVEDGSLNQLEKATAVYEVVQRLVEFAKGTEVEGKKQEDAGDAQVAESVKDVPSEPAPVEPGTKEA
jgi:hypothetical protein